MKRLQRLGLVFLLALTVVMPAIADKAKSFYEKGRDAEARQNYEVAYENYKQAYDLKPKELQYRTAYERTKFLAAASHVHRGQLLREAGKLDDALKEFEAAITIDPSSFIAQQEAKRTRNMIQDAKSAPAKTTKAEQEGVSERLADAAGPVELAPISNQPITLKLSEDTKVIYETIGKLAGINVLFDPDYTSRRIKIELNGVTLNQALEIVCHGIEDVLASRYPQHHFRRGRYSGQTQGTGTKRHPHFLSFEYVDADRNPGRDEYAATDSRDHSRAAIAFAGSDYCSRYTGPDRPGRKGHQRHR